MTVRRYTCAIGVLLAGLIASPARAAPDRPDPDRMQPPEIASVQRHLLDARCYPGPIDGKPSGALVRALSACPDMRPLLRVETGMHTAMINRIGTDAPCRLLATGSDDKTVRLWSLPDGRPLRTQRLPVGAGDHGKIYAVAVSPDGSLIAAGGWDAAREVGARHSIVLFAAGNGTALRRLGAFDNVIKHLAFSPDGRRVAAALGGGQGIRVLDVASGRELLADRDLGKASYGVTFGPDGALFAAGYDGSLRRYEPDLRLSRRAAGVGGKLPFSVAVDPSGRHLAVGYADSAAVDLYDARSLQPTGSGDTAGIDNGNLGVVAWSGDGARLHAGGQYQRGAAVPVRRFTVAGGRVGEDAPVSGTTVTALVPCGDGAAFGTADPSFGLLRAEGAAVTLGRGRTADMRSKLGDAFTVSRDATRVRFGLGYGGDEPVLFDLDQATLSPSPANPADLAGPDAAGLPLDGWENSTAPRLGEREIALDRYETARAVAVRPDRDGFVLGADFGLRAFDAAGKLRWRAPAPAAAWGVSLARGGDLIVAAFGDGTVRWHRWSDGRELLALFVNAETRAWVAWTPSGYYTASPGAEDLIGWHVNRGWNQAADYFPASKFRDQYARADIVARVLVTLDEAEAVRQANASGRRAEAQPISERLPPVVSIVSPVEGTTLDDEAVRLDYRVRSPSGLPVDAVDVLIDGRPVPAGMRSARASDAWADLRGCLEATQGLGRGEGDGDGCRGSVTIALPTGTSEVGLFARSGERVGEVARVRLTRAAPAVPAPSAQGDLLKPKLYALVVGVSAYDNPQYALGYAAKDAADFAMALDNQKGGLYGDVTVRRLTDGAATATAIREGLDWLTHQVTSRDVGLVYLAGHGVLDERERYYFIAADSDATRLRATAVPREDFADALDALAGRAMLFLDSCHSGAVAGGTGKRGGLDINAVVNEFARSERGVVTFTASTGRQLSQEDPSWNNGAFTKAVVEGLGLPGQKAKADLLNHGQITTSELDAYVRERVKVLTRGEQSPIMIRPATVPDFTFALTR